MLDTPWMKSAIAHKRAAKRQKAERELELSQLEAMTHDERIEELHRVLVNLYGGDAYTVWREETRLLDMLKLLIPKPIKSTHNR